MKHATLKRGINVNHSIAFILFVILVSGFHSTKVWAQQKTGEELFAPCKVCHNIDGGKLIGPPLRGITERHEEEWLIRFIRNSQEVIQSGDEYAVKLFEEYNKVPMPPNPTYTDDDIRTLINYIENYQAGTVATTAAGKEDTQAVQPEPDYFLQPEYITKAEKRNFFVIFVISLLFFLGAVFDLIITKKIKAKFVHVIIIGIAIYIMGEIIVVEAQGLGRQQYYSPDQPIAFSHKVHAGQNKIDCQYCHTSVEESKHAGIPSVQLCMNCHNLVKEGKQTGTEEISKIYAALESGKPIEWIRVHNLPDHAYFNHAQHVKVGKIECQQCHGPVETMERIIQVENLGMGWCINCHRTTEVQFTNNDFYKHYTKLHEELNAGKRSRITVDNIGGNDCQKCHY